MFDCIFVQVYKLTSMHHASRYNALTRIIIISLSDHLE